MREHCDRDIDLRRVGSSARDYVTDTPLTGRVVGLMSRVFTLYGVHSPESVSGELGGLPDEVFFSPSFLDPNSTPRVLGGRR